MVKLFNQWIPSSSFTLIRRYMTKEHGPMYLWYSPVYGYVYQGIAGVRRIPEQPSLTGWYKKRQSPAYLYAHRLFAAIYRGKFDK